jgi:chemotaxis protein histidine kinase CheA
MELKDVAKRLDIIKLSISIHDTNTIKAQSEYLKKLNNLKLNEIIALLDSKNYRQALYLIKKFKEDNDIEETIVEASISKEEKEYVINVDDMLKMSPIAKETINQFKESSYSADDLEAFSKNIAARKKEEDVKTVVKEKEVIELPEEDEEPQELTYATKIKTKEQKSQEEESQEIDKAINDANKDTPLDEISSKVMKKETKKKRTQVISSYKTLRSKFAKHDRVNEISNQESKNPKKEEVKKDKKSILDKFKKNKKEEKKEQDSKKSVNKQEEKTEPKNEAKKEEIREKSTNSKSKKNSSIAQETKNDIYPPVPHIEEKFRQAFVLYPPLKESDIWVEEVAKFLKYITNSSYTDSDINKFMEEYNYYIEKNDIMRASQFLLLASCTDAIYPQFMLARELFRGKVLKRNIKKSYELMKQLANSGYPDAICDLGQFYEYGVGMPENKKTALKLYEKAFELGLQRATKHINRVKESQRGFLGMLKKLLK